ncbi:MAG: hypothetical protein ACRDUV_20695 [Pseudonocardiaceae bacterium]
MTARVDEIAQDIFRICTHRPDGLAEGLVYNQFLIRAEQPLLMHTGMRTIFADVAEAVGRLIRLEDLRWISGAHASRPDEFGSVNDFLAAAPNAQVVAGKVAVNVCLRHMVDRTARALADNEVLELGDRTVRFVATAHVPFWEAGVLLDERERVLFCGDLFTVAGNPPPVSDADLIAPALDFERRLKHLTVSAHLPPVLRTLAALQPRMLACMHGPAYNGDAVRTLQKLAAHYDAQLSAA